ncbi:hypothetical protein BV133_2361 [Blastochloris viridis]|uniref:Uncharacterized protein n=1 Tax=Blastochloris viridis TaxID=1079 RepID=A0A182D3F9_BLAVI|nr:hypothetical protein BV133_2361 [Blastochloris viridis]
MITLLLSTWSSTMIRIIKRVKRKSFPNNAGRQPSRNVVSVRERRAQRPSRRTSHSAQSVAYQAFRR